MKAVPSSVAAVGLHEIQVAKSFAQDLAHRRCWANFSQPRWCRQRGRTWCFVEATSCPVHEEEGREGDPEKEEDQEEEREKESEANTFLTGFQLVPTDMRLGCPPCIEVQGNSSRFPSHWLPQLCPGLAQTGFCFFVIKTKTIQNTSHSTA